MTKPGRTEINLLRPTDVWHPHVGAPRGNRYAAKDGIAWKDLTRRIRALKRRLKQLQEGGSDEKGAG